MSKEKTKPSEPKIHTEYEVKVLEIDDTLVAQKLEKIGATKILDTVTYIEGFDFIPDQREQYKSNAVPSKLSPLITAIGELSDGSESLLSQGAYLRLREEGAHCEAILKYKVDETIEGVKAEREISVPIVKGEWDEMREGLTSVGLQQIVTQEKKRTSFLYKALHIRYDIDTWPKVSPYLEVEAPTEELITQGLQMIGFERNQATPMTGKEIFEKYHVDPSYLVFPKKV